MSQTVAPDETLPEVNPVGTQDVSLGVAKSQFEVTAWKPRIITKFVINFPSGQRALVKHLDTMDLVRAKLVEELDFFTKKLFPAAIASTDGDEISEKVETGIWSVLNDTEKRCRFFDLTNRLMEVSSIEPRIINDGVAIRKDDKNEWVDVFGAEVEDLDEQLKLFGKPIPPLKEGEVYASSINFGDRMAFFTELNKPLEVITPFRSGSDAVLASLEPSPSVEVQAE